MLREVVPIRPIVRRPRMIAERIVAKPPAMLVERRRIVSKGSSVRPFLRWDGPCVWQARLRGALRERVRIGATAFPREAVVDYVLPRRLAMVEMTIATDRWMKTWIARVCGCFSVLWPMKGARPPRLVRQLSVFPRVKRMRIAAKMPIAESSRIGMGRRTVW